MELMTAEGIGRMARELSTVAASPAFLELVQRIAAAPAADKLATAQNFADTSTLVQHGIEPPADFRITTRTFEEPEGVASEVGSPQFTRQLHQKNRVVRRCRPSVLAVSRF